MALIYETENFTVESHEHPEIDRLEGGHLKINPKVKVIDRTKLSPALAREMARLTMLTGEALVAAMAQQGIEIGRINYQDNGNWRPELHVHLYGRAKTATKQPYGEPITPGHQDDYQPLNERDRQLIKEQIEALTKTEKYSLENW